MDYSILRACQKNIERDGNSGIPKGKDGVGHPHQIASVGVPPG